MESREPYYESSTRYTLDYLIRSPETRKAIDRAEAEAGEYIDTFSFDPQEEQSDYIDSKIEELNEYLSVPYEQGCTAIGKAYFGNELEIHPDENPSHMSESNVDLVALKDVDFCGFELRNIPGTLGYKAMIMCIEPVDYSDSDPEIEVKAYYFLPEDIISISSNNHVDTEALGFTLKAHVSRMEKPLQSLSSLDAKEQYELLDKLAYSPAADIMAIYGDDEVHVDSDLFYRIEYSRKHGARLEKVDTRGEDVSGVMVEMPLGIVQGCAFIESMINFTDESREYKLDSLLEDEPCIVLTDDLLVPIYLIPISQFKDAMIINSGNV